MMGLEKKFRDQTRYNGLEKCGKNKKLDKLLLIEETLGKKSVLEALVQNRKRK